MIATAFAIIALLLAAAPCALFLTNLRLYRRLPPAPESHHGPVSVLIPARDEERNIAATIAAVLANRDVELEVIVLDDNSSDTTAQIVAEFAKKDPRVRIEKGLPLPANWCGKQYACHILAGLAQHPVFVFVDADVRLAPNALSRLTAFLQESGAQLVSGVPRQELATFSDHLLLPLIHFVLLGFLPLAIMRRRGSSASCSAGCGQLLVAEREAYFAAGGHAAFRDQMHDGLKLPRAFRTAGFRTDLFDATDVATCRMYRMNAEVWRGLSKNASEGLAAPKTIVPVTIMLFVGQLLPFLLLGIASVLSPAARITSVCAVILVYLPRLVAFRRFHHSLGSALLHPLGVLALLAIQWWAFFRQLVGKPAEWKGRQYRGATLKPV